MAELTTKARNALSKSTFAGPDRSYPIPDKSHAANAKARARQQYNAGHIGSGLFHSIVAKANRKLGNSTVAHTHAAPAKK
jgi:hypothetical protein